MDHILDNECYGLRLLFVSPVVKSVLGFDFRVREFDGGLGDTPETLNHKRECLNVREFYGRRQDLSRLGGNEIDAFVQLLDGIGRFADGLRVARTVAPDTHAAASHDSVCQFGVASSRVPLAPPPRLIPPPLKSGSRARQSRLSPRRKRLLRQNNQQRQQRPLSG